MGRHDSGRRSQWARHHHVATGRESRQVEAADIMSKRSEKPKKQGKQKPTKTLKERRNEKRAAKKLGSSSLVRPEG